MAFRIHRKPRLSGHFQSIKMAGFEIGLLQKPDESFSEYPALTRLDAWHLSVAAILQTKPTGKGYTLGDIDGLSLAVTARAGMARRLSL
ncbi:hypothetical protein EXW72_24100 [Pseudomonas sp. BCA14]|nr:hypothetical protein EXW70_25535 [Pseudomonas sp. JMN1]TFF04325.1 hypothetical protein EXW71_27755 [Pseudomonas sp. BCA17]TFF20117.1 hypothetical protein EXW72_24100 [Pseudomonas sp. BCA14]TFF20376.1 hypothetical protein EXW73_23635 [Pseudomonas sp. BCA13]